MASCCRRYRARPLKALGHDPQFLVNRPAPPATSLDHLKPFNLSTALMAVHKDCYAPIGLIQQGGPRRRETPILVMNGEERSCRRWWCGSVEQKSRRMAEKTLTAVVQEAYVQGVSTNAGDYLCP